jgi:arginine:ornithine antiporter/lysine permease
MATTGTGTGTARVQKLTLMTMAGMVVGSMVGAGVFSLPSTPGTPSGAKTSAGRRSSGS